MKNERRTKRLNADVGKKKESRKNLLEVTEANSSQASLNVEEVELQNRKKRIGVISHTEVKKKLNFKMKKEKKTKKLHADVDPR